MLQEGLKRACRRLSSSVVCVRVCVPVRARVREDVMMVRVMMVRFIHPPMQPSTVEHPPSPSNRASMKSAADRDTFGGGA